MRLLVLALAAPLAAQAPDSARTLPDIVVTATRSPMPREAVTSSVTVLDGAALRARGLATVADALRELPGASVVRTGSFGAQTALFLRGGESNFTQVLIDDVPVNDPGGSFDFAALSLDNVERIEILRGPASVLYGSDAVSGVVHVITGGRADGRTGGQVGVRYGTYGTLDAHASAQGGGGPLAFSVGAGRQASDGIYAFNNRYENLVGSARAGLSLGATTLNLTARLADGTYHFPTNSAGVAVDSNQFQETELLTAGFDVAQRLSAVVEARAQVAVNRLDGRTSNEPDFVGDSRSTSDRILTRRRADARVNLTLGHTLLTIGSTFEGEHEVTASEFLSGFGTFASSFDETRRNIAGYAQATGTVGAVALSAGARIDDNERFGTFVTGRGGVGVRLRPATRLRAAVGTGFKEPTFFENYGGSGVVGNPDLAPERSVSAELGVEQWVIEGSLSAEATVFIQRFDDLIEYVALPPALGDPNYVNVAAARADGLELSATAAPARGVHVTARYAYLVSEVTAAGEDPTFAAGQQLLRRPRHAASAQVALDPLPALRVTAGTRITGPRADLDYAAVDFVTVFDPVRVTLDAYALFDLTASWTVTPGVTLDAGVQNLLDTSYEDVLGFRTPGRTISVGGRLTR